MITFDSSYLIGKSHFEEDGTQNHLVFQPLNEYFKLITNTWSILSWQSKGLSNENIDPPTTSLSPSINYVGNKIRVKFTGSCLKQSNNLTYTHKHVATPLCLGNISKNWSVDNMKKTGFTGYVYDFSVDYDTTDVDDIKDIHKYLTK